MTGRYLMVVPVPGFRVKPNVFEIEGAFAQHLRELRARLGPLATTLVVAGPEMSGDARRRETALERIVEDREGIVFRPMFPATLGRARYLLSFPRTLAKVVEEVRAAEIVHASNSGLFRPFEFPALVVAAALGKKTVTVTDIDNRRSAWMNYQTGCWSLREYVTTRLLHDTYSHLQHVAGVRMCSLVLMKGRSLVEDYGRGRPNVKLILDSAFAGSQIISAEALAAKRRDVEDSTQALRTIYFGRLVAYKGVDQMLHAVRRAVDFGVPLTFEVIGDGPEADSLRALASHLDLSRVVTFRGALPFGEPLFERLYGSHVLLAAPLSEDTPRSALDACAAGIAISAFDTYYYRELAQLGAPIVLSPWPDSDALARSLLALHEDRTRLSRLLSDAVLFARDNTQEKWLERRIEWTRSLFQSNGSGYGSS